MSWFSSLAKKVGHAAGEILKNPIVDAGLGIAAGIIGGPVAGMAVAGLAGEIGGNQAKQEAKGAAGAEQTTFNAEQAAADAKLKQQHAADIFAQSQAGAVARKRMGGTIDDSAAASAPSVLNGPPSASGLRAYDFGSFQGAHGFPGISRGTKALVGT